MPVVVFGRLWSLSWLGEKSKPLLLLLLLLLPQSSSCNANWQQMFEMFARLCQRCNITSSFSSFSPSSISSSFPSLSIPIEWSEKCPWHLSADANACLYVCLRQTSLVPLNCRLRNQKKRELSRLISLFN